MKARLARLEALAERHKGDAAKLAEIEKEKERRNLELAYMAATLEARTGASA